MVSHLIFISCPFLLEHIAATGVNTAIGNDMNIFDFVLPLGFHGGQEAIFPPVMPFI